MHRIKGNETKSNITCTAPQLIGTLLPVGDLHGSVLGQVLVHLEGLGEQVRLVAHALLQALELGAVEVVGQDGLVVGVRALLDDDAGALTGREATDVGETLVHSLVTSLPIFIIGVKAYLFGDDHVEVVLGLVDVSAHGHDARHTGGVGLAGPGAGGVHDTVLGATQEVCGATETVQHARAHDASAVGVGVDVDLNGGVHADAAQTLDDLGGVGDLLRAEEQLVGVAVPVVVEALEAVGRELDGGGGGEVEVAGVEQVQEGVLKHLSPYLEVLEVRTALAEAADDGVGDVSDTRLDRKQVLGHAAHVDLVLPELNQVRGDGLGSGILGGIRGGLVRVVRLDNGHNLLGVNWDVGGSDTVLGAHDEVGAAARRNLGQDNVVQALHARAGSVDLDDDLVGHLNQFGGSTNGRTGDDATVLGDGGGFNHSNIQLGIGLVQCVPSLLRLEQPECFNRH